MSSFKEKGLLLDCYDDWCRKCWKEHGPNHKASSTVEESEASDADSEGSSSAETEVGKESEYDE